LAKQSSCALEINKVYPPTKLHVDSSSSFEGYVPDMFEMINEQRPMTQQEISKYTYAPPPPFIGNFVIETCHIWKYSFMEKRKIMKTF
jgi:hypothetical protein